MKTAVLVSSFVLLALAGGATSNLAHAARFLQTDDEFCADNEKEAVLEVFLDPNPEETGWQLVCDDDNQVVWDSPVGTFTAADAETWVVKNACIATTSTCTLTITDSSGNGLLNDGFYTLTYGAETIGVYEYGVNRPFTEDSYCFGPTCGQEEPATSVQVEDGNGGNDDEFCADDEEEAVLEVFLDRNPQETGWQLVCDDNQVVWDRAVGTFTENDAETWILEDACIAKTSTCTLTLTDAAGDGLLNDGFYSFTYGAVTVGVYEYGVNRPFMEDSLCFGPGCDELPLELAEEEAESTQNKGEEENKPPMDDIANEPKVDGSSISSTNKNTNQNDDSNVPAIVGGVIGGLAAVALVVVLVTLVRRNKNENRNAAAAVAVDGSNDKDSETTASEKKEDFQNVSLDDEKLQPSS